MKKWTATGQTVEEAVEKVLAQLNVPKEFVAIDVIQQPKRPLLGLFGGKEAIVEVKVNNPFDCVVMFLRRVVEQMGLHVSIERRVEQMNIFISFSGQDVARLIGKRGQTLNALQLLAQGVLNRYSDEGYTVLLDAGGYRKYREETLIRLANKWAEQAIKSGKDVVLEPMTAWERKIIHAALSDHARVCTFSEGKEPHRHIVISLK